MSAHTRIEQIKNEGYYLDFGDVFNKAFENYKRIALQAGIVFILLTIVVVAIVFGAIGAFWGVSAVSDNLTGMNVANFSGVTIVFYILGVTVLSGLTAPLTAGIIKMAYNAAHHLDISVGTAFEYYRSSYFKDLFLSAILISACSLTVGTAIESMHIPVLGTFLNYMVSFFTMLAVPLIIFGELNAIEAIKASIMIVFKQLFIILGLVIVAAIISVLGIFGFCLGIFFTLPLLFSMHYCIYDEIIGTGSHSELDEIGASVE